MASRGDRLRHAAALSTAAYAVHQLRYLLEFGDDADQALASQGHNYLEGAGPVVGVLLAFVLASALRSLVVGRASDAPVRRRVLWLLSSAALLLVFTTQEALEGALASGHADGLAGVFGNGGWITIPLAMCFGAALSAFMYVTAEASGGAQLRGVVRLPQIRSPSLLWTRPCEATFRPFRPRLLAGRGPPLLLTF